MKHVIALIYIFYSSSYWAVGQSRPNNAVYFSSELNVGNYIGLDFYINYHYKDKYTAKIGYSGNIGPSKSKPRDFSSGLIGVFLLGLANPYDKIQSYQLGLGVLHYSKDKEYVRMNFNIGIGYASIRQAGDWQLTGAGIFSRNYSWTYSYYNALLFSVNPKFELPFTKYYGLTISPAVHFTKGATYFGIGFGHMIGLLKSN